MTRPQCKRMRLFSHPYYKRMTHDEFIFLREKKKNEIEAITCHFFNNIFSKVKELVKNR